jgi:hypothetical protein
MPGFVGVSNVRLRLTDVLPAGASLELKVVVNGKDSNTVLLPVE